MTILEHYKYAQLATAAYVRVGNEALNDQATFVARAASTTQRRLPTSLATHLFDPPQGSTAERWSIAHYFGSDRTIDPIAAADNSGLGATLFSRGTEKVLAIRGVEFEDDFSRDLLGASLGQIGILGMALTQTVSMVNLLQRLKTSGTALQIQVQATSTLPGHSNYVPLTGSNGSPVYLSFSTYTAQGTGAIGPGQQVSVTGHSLGGELAVIAALLFPDIVSQEVTIFNAAGLNPDTGDYAGLLTNPLIQMFSPVSALTNLAISTALSSQLGSAAAEIRIEAQQVASQLLNTIAQLISSPATIDLSNPAMAFSGLTIHNIRGEDLAPGDDTDVVASALTGADIYPTAKDLPMEANSHAIEPLMDSLALQHLLIKLAPTLDIDQDPTLSRMNQLYRAQTRDAQSLSPGMRVVSEILLDTRSVLEYLLSPVQKIVSEAGRER